MDNTIGDRVVNVLYLYILLIAIPLFLGNFSLFHFISQGTSIYTVYIYFLYLLLPITLLNLKNDEFKVKESQFILIYFIMLVHFVASSLGLIKHQDYLLFSKSIVLSIGIFTFLLIPDYFSLAEKQVQSFMKKILYFILFASIYNIIFNIDLIFYGTSNLYIKKQFASFFSNRNTYAMVLVIGIIANTSLFFTEKRKIYLFTFLLFFINLIWTGSTNSLISTIIFLSMFFTLFYKKNYIKKSLFILSGFLFLFVLYINGLFEGIVNFIQKGNLDEFSGRTEIWMVGLNTFKNNILFGVGAGRSETILSNYGYGVDKFHNGFIEILVSGGVMLLLIYIILGLYFFIKLRKLYSVNKLFGSIYISAFLSVIFSMFFESHSFFGGGFYSGLLTIFYLFIPLVLMNYYNKPIKK